MTGRGKDRTMYGKDEFIDDVSTLNGGIDYAYYHWQRYHLLRNEIGDLQDRVALLDFQNEGEDFDFGHHSEWE